MGVQSGEPSYGSKHATTAATATAAVSTRRMLGVSRTARAPDDSKARSSSAVQPPSGPTNAVTVVAEPSPAIASPIGIVLASTSVARYHTGPEFTADAVSASESGVSSPTRMTPDRRDCL